MCAIDALDGVKKKGNSVIANFAANQASKAEDKMMVYEKAKAELMSQGVPESKAIKIAEKMIKEMAGASANSGMKTNNDKDSTIGTSKQERERTEGETNIEGKLKTEKNIETGKQSNAGNDSDNMAGSGRPSDSLEIAKAAKEVISADSAANSFSFNPAIKRIAKRLEALGVTLTPNIRKALEALEEDDPRSLKFLSEKLQTMNRVDVQSEMKRLNGE